MPPLRETPEMTRDDKLRLRTTPEIPLRSIISSAFRAGCWLCLRWVPISPQAYLALVTLYGIHVIQWQFGDLNPTNEAPAPVKVVDIKDEHPNGVNGGPPVEGIVVKRAGPNPIPEPVRFLLSLPSTSVFTQLFTFLFNTLLLGLVIASTFRIDGSTFTKSYEDLTFARVGATYPTGVKFHIRYPGLRDLPQNGTGSLKVLWRPANAAALKDEDSGWSDGPVLTLDENTDWVGFAELKKLEVNTEYQYRLASPNSSFLPYPPTPMRFKTFPAPRSDGGKFSFIATSRFSFNFPYKPLAPSNSIHGLDYLADYLSREDTSDKPTPADEGAIPEPEELVSIATTSRTKPPLVAKSSLPSEDAPEPEPLADLPQDAPVKVVKPTIPAFTPQPQKIVAQVPSKVLKPAFMFLLGDLQHDAPLPFKSAEIDYLKSFRELYASVSFRRVYEKLPVFHVFSPSLDASPKFVSRRPEVAQKAYEDYSQVANYPSISREGSYYEFEHGDNAFFVLDTETFRSSTNDLNEGPTLLGRDQFKDFIMWANKVNHTHAFKFVISPVPLSHLWGTSEEMNTWADYPLERTKVIDVLAFVPNVIVVSGGRHEFAAISYLNGTFTEFVTGPLSGAATYGVGSKLDEKNTVVRVKRENISVKLPPGGHGSDPSEEVVITNVEEIVEERLVKSVHSGNHRWSTFEIDTTNEKPTVTINVFQAGAPEWSTTIIGQPKPTKINHTVGSVLTNAMKEALGMMRFFRSKY